MDRRRAKRLFSPGVYKAAKWASLVAVPAVIVVFGTIGFNLSPRFYPCMAAAILPLGSYIFFRRRQRQAELRLRACLSWGKPGGEVGRPPSKEDRPHRKSYLEWTAGEDEHTVDERTWSDLGMDGVCKEMDVCFTDAGRNELYRLLHHCLVPEDEARSRAALVEAIGAEESLREKLLEELASVGQERDADPAPFLWGNGLRRDRLAGLFIGMGCAAAASVLSFFLLPLTAAVILIIVVFITNMWLYYSKARNVSSLIPSLRVMSRMLQAAARIAAWRDPLPGVDIDELRRLTAGVSRLRRPFRWLLTGAPGAAFSVSGDILETIFLYIKIFFVVDLIAFDRIVSALSRDPDGARSLYRALGRLDALHALASYRFYRSRQCVPVLEAGAGFEAEKLYHPMLPKAVRNNVAVSRPGAVVTGTNMAGKSTFLRTLGINAILAQTTGACFAQSYRADRFLVMSSIEKRDDLKTGKSFYYDEAERIFRMIEEVGGSAPVLLLIDELLSGTNSLERESASVAILHYLARRDALAVAATHDITIASRLASLYPPFYFTDRADETGLSFDYKIRPGIVQSRNAIKLLALIGYPDDLIAEAMKEAGAAAGGPATPSPLPPEAPG